VIEFRRCELFTEDVVARSATAIVEDLLFLFVRDWLLYSHLLSVSEDLSGGWNFVSNILPQVTFSEFHPTSDLWYISSLVVSIMSLTIHNYYGRCCV